MDISKKLVSIIMPTFNAAHYLREAVDSILDQTYKKLELLVIDDQSTDDTIDILSAYARLDKRVKIIKGHCNGIGAALNLGIDLADGEYIARMDADDISLKDRIEEQVNFMEEHPYVGVCSTQIQVLQEDGYCRELWTYPEINDQIKINLLNYCCIAHPTVMFRSQVVKGKWRYNAEPAEDYDLWTRMAVTENFACLPKALLYYRIHMDNSSILIDRLTMSNTNNRIIKAYIQRLFNLDLLQYKEDDFYIMENSVTIKEPIKSYLSRQYQLLVELEENNRKCNIFDKEIMQKFICKRWQLVWEKVEFDGRIIDSKWIHNLGRWKIDSDSVKGQVLKEVFDRINQLFKEHKKFVIYGLGESGKKLLEDWEDKKNQINWILVALIDKNKKFIDSGEETVAVMKPRALISLEFDYVFISSKKYYAEIEKELLAIGIEKKKLLYGGNIFNIVTL